MYHILRITHQIINTDYNNMNFDVIKIISTNIDDFSTELHQFSTNIDDVIIGRKKSTEYASISLRCLFFSTEHLDKIVHTFQTGFSH